MQSSQSGNLQELLSGLEPILRPRLSPEPSVMERTVTEGLILPDSGSLMQNAIDAQSVPRLLHDTIEWIKTVLRAVGVRASQAQITTALCSLMLIFWVCAVCRMILIVSGTS